MLDKLCGKKKIKLCITEQTEWSKDQCSSALDECTKRKDLEAAMQVSGRCRYLESSVADLPI